MKAPRRGRDTASSFRKLRKGRPRPARSVTEPSKSESRKSPTRASKKCRGPHGSVDLERFNLTAGSANAQDAAAASWHLRRSEGLDCMGDTPQKFSGKGVIAIEDAMTSTPGGERADALPLRRPLGCGDNQDDPDIGHDRRIEGDSLHTPLIGSVGRHLCAASAPLPKTACSSACTVKGSAVVRPARSGRHRSLRLVPKVAVGTPRAESSAAQWDTTDVFPFVPVTPMTVIDSEGAP